MLIHLILVIWTWMIESSLELDQISYQPLRSSMEYHNQSYYLRNLMSVKLSRVERYIRSQQEQDEKQIATTTTTTDSSIEQIISTTTKSSPPMFKPKHVEPPGDEEYSESSAEYDYNYYYDELPEPSDTNKIPDQKATTGSPKWTTKNNSSAMSKFNLKILFDFVEIILRPTRIDENTVEIANKLNKQSVTLDDATFPDDTIWKESSSSAESTIDDQNMTNSSNNLTTTTTTTSTTSTTTVTMKPVSSKNESLSWYQKDNVCYSKIAYQKENKNQADYCFINNCKGKPDSEFCVTNIQAGFKNFELHSTLFCCPNYQLNLTSDSCEEPPVDRKPNLLSELKNSFLVLNSTLDRYFYQNDISTSESQPRDFLNQVESIFAELTDDHDKSNQAKYTVFLWDSNKFIEYIKSVLAFNDFTLNQKFDKILNTIRNHLVPLHHPTQSIVSNEFELESMAKKKLRFSTIILENKSMEFVNCKEILVKNHYYQSVLDGSDHNYRLLIHKLQTSSIITPLTKTVFQILNEKILKSTLAKNNFKIYQRLFEASRDKLTADLNNKPASFFSLSSTTSSAPRTSLSSSINIFVPTDEAFRASLRPEQIESLVADKTCGYKFLFHNIVFEEICPTQLIKYGAEYSSPNQRANFIAVNEKNSNLLYFNGQIVNLSKSSVNTASNGMIYRLSTLNLNGVVDFLYDIVAGYKKKIPANFINALNSNWMDVIKNETNDSTLFLPIEEKSSLNDPKGSDQSNGNASLVSTNPNTVSNSQPIDRVNLFDYLIKPRYTFYDLNDGKLLTSVSNKKYLINVYQLENQLDFMSFIPSRNFQRKTINCQLLEMPDLTACNAQLIVYKSETYQIPLLNTLSVLDFISYNADFSILSRLLELCGSECKEILSNLRNNGESVKRKGFTLILPSNAFFNRHPNSFAKLTKNATLLQRQLQSNIFYGTFCYTMLKSSMIMENLLNRRIMAKRLHPRVTEGNVYLSDTGVLIHKSDAF